MNQLVESAVPYFMKRVLPTIADSSRSLLNSDVTHVVSALAGKPVDILYSRLSGISCSFFSKGWGNLRVVDLAQDLQYLQSEWPSQQLKIDWKLKSEGYQDRKPFKVYEGTFKTPCVKRIWDALPPESRQGVVQLIVPASGVCRAGVVHLAATGDQGFTRRAKLAAPLLTQGVAGLILESPFYGCRKPPHHFSSKLDHVSDLLTLGWATIFESMHLLRWLRQNGYEQTGLSGTSMGGVHACLATSLYPDPVACVPFLAPRSAAVAYCDGAMWPVTAWQALLKDVDDRNNDLMSVLEDATRPHDYGVVLRRARVSPHEIASAQLQHSPSPASSDRTLANVRPANTQGPGSSETTTLGLPGIDWLSGLVPLPSMSLDPSRLTILGTNLIPGMAQSAQTAASPSPVSSTDQVVNYSSMSKESVDPQSIGTYPMEVTLQDTTGCACPDSQPSVKVNEHSVCGSASTAGTQGLAYQPVQVYSQYHAVTGRVGNQEYVLDDGWDVGYDEQWERRYGGRDSAMSRSQNHDSAAKGCAAYDERMEQGGVEQRMRQQAEAFEQLAGSCQAQMRGASSARAWSEVQAARVQDVVELKRHLSLVKLRAVLETFTDITRFPVPRRPDAAVFIAAKDDAYVNKESVHEVHQYWEGSELRMVPGGHVSAFLTQQAAVREALVDALNRLGQSQPIH